MTPNIQPPTTPAATLDVAPPEERLATCPLCHTTDQTLTNDALSSGEGWRCVRCGQWWDARRLATVAAYAVSAAEHDRKSR